MTMESETSRALEANDEARSGASDPLNQQSQAYVDPVEHDRQRGQRILAALKHAARAARLQAQVAELEYALEQATRGIPSELSRWLEDYDQQSRLEDPSSAPSPKESLETPSAAQSAALPATEIALYRQPSTVPHPPTSPAGDGSGWDSYLEFARQRLAKRAQSIIAERQNSTTGQALQTDALLNTTIAPSAVTQLTTPPVQELHPSTKNTTAEETTAEDPSVKDIGAAHLYVHAAVVQAVESIEQPRDQQLGVQQPVESPQDLVAFDIGAVKASQTRSPLVNQPMMRGMGLSLLAHGVALIGLLMITIRLPRESASLGSQVISVQRVTEALESSPNLDLPEPLEIDLPLEGSSPMEAANSSVTVDLASSVPPSLSLASAATQPLGPAGLPAATSDLRGAGSTARATPGPSLPNSTSTSGKFFGAGAGGNFFCYVVDSSGSMRGRAWESAKLELLRSLTTLVPTQRFYIVFFAQSISAVPEPGGNQPARSGLLASPENIDHARRWIDSVKLDRGGPPNEALQLAIEREPDAIYLLTDGVTQADVCGFLRKINRVSDIVSGEQVRVPIHAIAYHSLDGQQLLRQLARENAGQFHYVPAK